MRDRAARIAAMAQAGHKGFGRPVMDRRHDEEAADPQSPALIRAAAWGYQRALTDMALAIVNAGAGRAE